MVLTYMEPPYDELYKSQLVTWDVLDEEDVHTLYYHGGADNVQCDLLRQHHKSTSTIIQTEDNNLYYYMAGKFRSALRYALLSKFDIIYRTNSSSYISKKKLKEFAATLPTEKLYAGWTMTDSEDFGGLVVSGAGIFLSRDTAEILAKEIDPEKELEEDIYIGRILRKHGIVAIDDKSRYDVPMDVPDEIPAVYHYRLKCGAAREVDVENMKKIHQKIIQL